MGVLRNNVWFTILLIFPRFWRIGTMLFLRPYQISPIPFLFSSVIQDIPLAAPVLVTMKASVSEAQLPSCSFLNENTGRWDSEGLALDSAAMLSNDEDRAIDYDVSCVSFHLSYFTVTTTEVEPAFTPVPMVSIYN